VASTSPLDRKRSWGRVAPAALRRPRAAVRHARARATGDDLVLRAAEQRAEARRSDWTDAFAWLEPFACHSRPLEVERNRVVLQERTSIRE
jgi:hypothetical protein